MALQPFSWGANGQKASPSSVKRQAEIAAALAARGGAPQSLGEGLNRVGEALLANSYSARAAAGEEAGAVERKALMDALMGNPDPTMADIAGAFGNEWVTSDPGSAAVLQALMGAEIQQNDPLRQLQIQAAQQGIEMGGIELENARNPQPEPGFTLLTSEEAASFGLPDGAYQRGPDNKIYEIGGGGTNVNINTGDGAPGLGKLSPDYGYVLDPETREPVIDQATGLPRAAPVPGSPAAIEAAALDAKLAAGEGRRDTFTDTITNAASVARTLAAKPGNTGMVGGLWANLSETDAAELRRQVDVLKANATIENLTAMRQASPTGGALGSVTEKEGAMLAAASGAIDPGASPADFQRQLDTYERTLLRIVHGPAEGDRVFAETRPPAQSQADPGIFSGGQPASGEVVDYTEYFR